MNILALNAFHGGSHSQYLNRTVHKSRHNWLVLSEEGRFWKWRMRHAAVNFCYRIKNSQSIDWNRAVADWADIDVIFCTSMLNVAELKGLLPNELRDKPIICYFHENQLTYPNGPHYRYDSGLCAIQVNSSLAADELWFNSVYHRDDFRRAVDKYIKQCPQDYPSLSQEILQKSHIQYPGICDTGELLNPRKNLEFTIAWAARWEDEKNPQLFFEAMQLFKKKGFHFRLHVMGESLDLIPQVFKDAQKEFVDEIKCWGFQKSREDYLNGFKNADIFISTAEHEFFGISAVEALSCGCLPVVPAKLAYPEVLEGFESCFYQPDSFENLVDKMILMKTLIDSDARPFSRKQCHEAAQKYSWEKLTASMDNRLLELSAKF